MPKRAHLYMLWQQAQQPASGIIVSIHVTGAGGTVRRTRLHTTPSGTDCWCGETGARSCEVPECCTTSRRHVRQTRGDLPSLSVWNIDTIIATTLLRASSVSWTIRFIMTSRQTITYHSIYQQWSHFYTTRYTFIGFV